MLYLLASQPKCYNVLVIALEANPDVPILAVVTEWLLHEESKMKHRVRQLRRGYSLPTVTLGRNYVISVISWVILRL